MTRRDSLRALYEAVKAGTAGWYTLPEMCEAVWGDEGLHTDAVRIAYCNGSLDAALALHEAVLPGWVYNIAPRYCHVIPPHDNGDQEAITGFADNPARAMLLAILAAMIEQEGEG
jgi:hypothetical protein